MSLLYTAITNKAEIVCHHQNGFKGYESDVKEYLGSIPIDQEKQYPISGGTLHALTRSGISCLCITDSNASRSQCLNYLRQVYNNFTSSTERVEKCRVSLHGGMQLDYARNLADDAGNFDMHGENNQLTQLRSQVNEVTVVIKENIDQVMQRGDRLDSLVTKTEELQSNANIFQTSAKRVHKAMWWENFRMKIIIGVVVFGILFILLMIILWQAGVFSKKSN